MKYKLAVFDMDGTILNTLTDLTNSVNHALRACGYEEHTKEEVRFYVGNGVDKLIERALPAGSSDAERARVKKAFMDHYTVHDSDNTGPYEGIKELLEKLTACGILTAVVSNKPDPAVRNLVKTYFDGLFSGAVGDMEGQAVKPAPDMCNRILRELGVNPGDAVYIGDSDTDIMTARNSGLDEILVSWGFRGREFLEEHGARMICDTPEEVFEAVTGKR
jgi:phosphoglycolate phosphatase